MRLIDIAEILIAFVMSAALLSYITGVFFLNGTVLAVVAFLFLFAGVDYVILREPSRRQSIRSHKYAVLGGGLAVVLASAVIAVVTSHFHDLLRGGFGIYTVVALIGLEIAYLPRACYWHERSRKRQSRLENHS